jgi:hypothetical protein
LVRRRKRDIYGNWVWEDDDEIRTPDQNRVVGDGVRARSSHRLGANKDNEELNLDWRDFVALSIASLETFLLPIVVFITVLFLIVLGLSFFR